jgi:hypothetical protein
MKSSTNPIKVLVQRFVTLPPLARMKVTKTLLELYSSEQAAREVKASNATVLRKSFLEQFWDEVEKAHNDRPLGLNPFNKAGGAGARRVKAAPEIDGWDGFLPWAMERPNLLALF